MPHDSFFKLDSEKREKIQNAMEKEFGNNSFEKASINRIVEDAGISKGSFWFYFENKEDAMNYLIEQHIEKEKKLAIEALEKNNGDLFQTYICLFDYLVKSKANKEKRELVPNICKDLIINNKKHLSNIGVPPRKIEKRLIEEEKFIELLDDDLLKNHTKEDIISLLKFLNFTLRTNLIECLMEDIDEKTASENFLRELEILKKGMYKNA